MGYHDSPTVVRYHAIPILTYWHNVMNCPTMWAAFTYSFIEEVRKELEQGVTCMNKMLTHYSFSHLLWGKEDELMWV